jgi:ankyrin repeat protein
MHLPCMRVSKTTRQGQTRKNKDTRNTAVTAVRYVRVMDDAASDALANAWSRVEATWRAAQQGNVPAVTAYLETFRGDSLGIAERGIYLGAVCQRRFDNLVDVAARNDWPDVLNVVLMSTHVPAKRELDRALVVAASAGSTDVVGMLLRCKASVEANSSHGSALTVAATHRQHDVVRLLLEAGASANAYDMYRHIPLACALKQADNVRAVELLVQAKARVNTAWPVDVPENYPLYQALHSASYVRLLLEAKASVRGTEMYTVVRRALVQRDCGQSPVTGEDDVSETARLLLAAKASVGTDSLGQAANAGHAGLVRQLLSAKASVNDGRHEYPLCDACHGGHVHIARLLLDAKACPDACDKSTVGPLSYAAWLPGRAELVRALLDAKATVNGPGGRTALHKAASHVGDLDVLHVLVDARADPNELVDGKTPLYAAARTPGNTATIAALLAAGAWPQPVMVERPARSPLHSAARACCTRNVQMLLDAKAYVNQHDAEGRTPLHVAASKDCDPVVRVLVDAKADVDILTGRGMRLRDYAVVRRVVA